MKKPNVLNRSMFNRGETSAYGRGITSNLVSDKQRQRYNYGGRVGLYHGGGQRTTGGYYARPWETRMDMRSEYNTPRTSSYRSNQHENIKGSNLSNFVLKNPKFGHLEYANAFLPSQLYSPTSSEGEDYRTITDMPGFRKLYQDYRDPETLLIDPDKIDVKTGLPIEEAPDDSFIEKEKEEVISKGPMGDEMWDQTTVIDEPGKIIRTDTDELDTPDKWAFLDENIAKKKKLARGHAAMEGAAAAAEWAFADTKAKQGAAIAKGLRSVGTIGSKYKGGAEDLKTKAQILDVIEGTKQEGKVAIQELKGEQEKWKKGYYEGSLKLQEQIAAGKEAGKSNKEIYEEFLRSGLSTNPLLKANHLSTLTNQKIEVADSTTEKLFMNPDNDGTVFIDSTGKLVKNVNGKKETVNELTDEFFTWE